MAKPRSHSGAKPIFSGRLDMDSAETAEKFRAAAASFTGRAGRSKNAAIEALKRESFLTKTGRIARPYTD